MDGVLNINKPGGPTSHDIVAKLRRILGEKRVGHAGTLDPLATGVLVVCAGKATRIVEHIVGQEKEYLAEMALGRTTTTEDVSGEITSEADASGITLADVERVIPKFTGRILQTPPMVSAVKYQGQRLYKLARKDIEVERQPRAITVHALEVTSFDQADGLPIVGLRVVCSSGTYIRTICADIGASLGVGGYMQSLVRTRVGRFVIDKALNLDNLEAAAADGNAESLLLSMDDALADFASVEVDSLQEGLVLHGGTIEVPVVADEGSLIRVKSVDGRLLALGKVHARPGGSVISPEKVFAEARG